MAPWVLLYFPAGQALQDAVPVPLNEPSVQQTPAPALLLVPCTKARGHGGAWLRGGEGAGFHEKSARVQAQKARERTAAHREQDDATCSL